MANLWNTFERRADADPLAPALIFHAALLHSES